jgi:hypothetical protein
MSINATARLGTPLSTKLVVALGLLLTAVGGGIAVRDHLRATTSTTAVEVPSQASGFTLPGAEHLLQFVGLMVAAVCIVGFLVVARSVLPRR